MIASAINGQGGNIETSGYHLDISSVNINVSSDQGADGLWLIDPVDFTIASSGGDMTGSALTSALASANVTILSSSGSSGSGGNITISDAVTWSANKLTLNANNNIYINANLLGSGTAQLELLYGQGAVASGNTSDYSILKTSSADSTSFSAQVTLADGNNFSTTLGSDGSAINYQVISDLNSLMNNASGNYALGANVDASGVTRAASLDYCGGLRCNTGLFTGNIDGLGHTIDSFTSNVRNTYSAGLFANIAGDLTFRNIGLTNRSTTSGIHSLGGFVGRIYSGTLNIINSYSSGTISGVSSGGFVGKVEGSTTSLVIKDSVNHINIINGENSGGFVGSIGGRLSIINSFNSGDIAGNVNLRSTLSNSVGGLVGYLNSSFLEIDTSYNAGSVSGKSYTGGLIGYAHSALTLTSIYNTGPVSGTTNYIGGLVGRANDSITLISSYNTGPVSGADYIGGLVGYALAAQTISSSYNTGEISNSTATNGTGGLIGYSNGSPTVTNSYNAGSVSGKKNTGGLIGHTRSALTLTSSYNTGAMSSSDYNLGGLIGYANASITLTSPIIPPQAGMAACRPSVMLTLMSAGLPP